jgi:predicted O-methyltransferase YrrM
MVNEAVIRTPPQYDRILARSEELQFSMNSDVLTGSLLRVLARTKPGGSFLELGTGCGLGSCWLLNGMSTDSSLISVDTDPRVQAIAREELGPDPRLTCVLGDGGEFLDKCEARFDLIYADAWPGKYTHLDQAMATLKPGGLYVIDDDASAAKLACRSSSEGRGSSRHTGCDSGNRHCQAVVVYWRRNWREASMTLEF